MNFSFQTLRLTYSAFVAIATSHSTLKSLHVIQWRKIIKETNCIHTIHEYRDVSFPTTVL